MKKLIAVALTLCLVCGAAALANTITNQSTDKTGTTTVRYNVPICTEYTVDIPASIDLIPDGNGHFKDGAEEITLHAEKVNVKGFQVDVILESTANGVDESSSLYLTNGKDRVRYMLAVDGGSMGVGQSALRWIHGEAATASKTVKLQVFPTEGYRSAGTYTDTLTFRVSTKMPDGLVTDPDAEGGSGAEQP